MPIYSFQDKVRETIRGEEYGKPYHKYCRPDQEAKNAEDRRKTKTTADNYARDIVLAKRMSSIGLTCGIIGFGCGLFPLLLPLGPVALVLGLLANSCLKTYGETSRMANWAIGLGAFDSFAGLGVAGILLSGAR